MLHREVPAIAADYDHVVIDGPPQVADVTQVCCVGQRRGADPSAAVRPRRIGVTSAVVTLLTEAAMVRPNLKAAFVISRKMVNTALARDVPGTLVDYRLPTLKASLAQRVAFAEALGAGLTVFDLNPRSAASVEVEALTKEVMEFAHGQDGDSGAAPTRADRR